jgi:hypothetical protein
LAAIIKELENPVIKSKVDFSRGFYFLSGRARNVGLRQRRYLIAEEKLKKTGKYVKYLSILPQIRGVAITNTLAVFNSRQKADIDLFVITGKKEVWPARFWAVAPLYLFGLRPKPGDTRDKFCLSFWVDESNLNLKPWKIEKDIYYVYWLATMMPVLGERIFNDFWRKNLWINDYLPNFKPPKLAPRYRVKKKFSLLIFFSANIFKKIQRQILPDKIKKISKQDNSDVVIADGVLKLHADDKRRDLQKAFEQKIKFQ